MITHIRTAHGGPALLITDVALAIPAAALRRAVAAAQAQSVTAGGVWDATDSALTLWSHPWAGPGANRPASRWLATICLGWRPPRLAAVEYDPGALRWADLRARFNALAGAPVWQPGFGQRLVGPARARRLAAALGLPAAATPVPRAPLQRLDAATWADDGQGVTRHSLAAVRLARRHHLLGRLLAFTVDSAAAPPWTATLTGSRGRLLLSGLGCGYRGEGPAGTLQVARSCGFVTAATPTALAAVADAIARAPRVQWTRV